MVSNLDVPKKPPPGTPCLVLYGPDRQPLQYFALEKDAMLIGRLDAVAGNFPDIDLDEWFDRTIIRKISRQHALILRTRAIGARFVTRLQRAAKKSPGRIEVARFSTSEGRLGFRNPGFALVVVVVNRRSQVTRSRSD